MLVLSRRLNEQIVLPDLNVVVRVVAVRGEVVRLGIEAPPEVKVVRQELLARLPAPEAPKLRVGRRRPSAVSHGTAPR